MIDVRNYNESLIGKFAPPGDKVLDPMMRRSTEFPQWVADNKAKLANKKVLMYCTGGVRCERASAYMGSQGIQNIYQLEGGIHRYLEECVLAPTPTPIASHREPSIDPRTQRQREDRETTEKERPPPSREERRDPQRGGPARWASGGHAVRASVVVMPRSAHPLIHPRAPSALVAARVVVPATAREISLARACVRACVRACAVVDQSIARSTSDGRRDRCVIDV